MKNKAPDVTTKFKRYLMLEKSLAANTVEAYMSDLKKLTDFIKASGTDMLSVSYHDLQEFAATLNDVGIHPRSQMRIISGIRGFFRFLVLDGYLEKDPSELLSSPKPGRHIPEVLSLEEIDMMVSAIDASTAEGQRNKAIIETLYGCGLRVSELCNLHLSDLILDDEYIKVTGKGNKQRLVPISHKAIEEINAYTPYRDKIKIRPGEEDFLFLSKWGKRISRITVFRFIKDLAAATGIKKAISPHTFRHSFATHMLEGGANLRAIQCMLGHECISTTEIYAHMNTRTLRNEILEHHPRNRADGDSQSS